jgi:hypothetical protein
VVAAFPKQSTAKVAVERLKAGGVPSEAIRVEQPGAADGEGRAELRAEMQQELSESWGAPLFFMTGEQAKGALAGTAAFTAAGIVVGLAVGFAWAFLADAAISPLARVVIAVVLSAVAFATAGFIVGGSMKPRMAAAGDRKRPMDDRRAVAERDVLVAVHSPDRETVERSAELLRQVGAERVDLVDAEGTPLPPQHEHPRPADPDHFWWRRAGHG